MRCCGGCGKMIEDVNGVAVNVDTHHPHVCGSVPLRSTGEAQLLKAIRNVCDVADPSAVERWIVEKIDRHFAGDRSGAAPQEKKE